MLWKCKNITNTTKKVNKEKKERKTICRIPLWNLYDPENAKTKLKL